MPDFNRPLNPDGTNEHGWHFVARTSQNYILFWSPASDAFIVLTPNETLCVSTQDAKTCWKTSPIVARFLPDAVTKIFDRLDRVTQIIVGASDDNERIEVEQIGAYTNVTFKDNSGHLSILLDHDDLRRLLHALHTNVGLDLEDEDAELVKKVDLETRLGTEPIEINRCPHCSGIFGLDSSWLEQLDDIVTCPFCHHVLGVGEER